MNSILESFYKKVIPGALEGEIDCEILIHIIFNVYYKEKNERLLATNKFSNVMIPTLVIDNISEFEDSLTSYVETALLFFKDKMPKYLEESNLKTYLICLAIVNMSKEDYLNPTFYFKKMTNIMNCYPFELSNSLIPIGFSNELSADLFYSVNAEYPNEECPYRFILYAQNNEDTYEFQTIRFYIENDVAYIGAIQGPKAIEQTPFKKKLKRTLYKANENVGIDNPIYNANPGAVVALTSFIGLLNSLGIYDVKILPASVQRWNDKQILSQTLKSKLGNNISSDSVKLKITQVISRNDDYFKRYDIIRLQLINTLKRFSFHFNDAEVHDEDPISIKCSSVQNGNNELLNEMYGLTNNIEKANQID